MQFILKNKILYDFIQNIIIKDCLSCPEHYDLKNGSCVYSAICGNNILEIKEECDDGNFIIHDGCSDTCIKEVKSSECKLA